MIRFDVAKSNRVRTLPFLWLGALLASCTFTPTLSPNPENELEFSVCQEATEAETAVPYERRLFQGRHGWFFFGHDLATRHSWLRQTDFIATLSRALAEQGVALVVVPVPGRALAEPQELYPDEPDQVAFAPAQVEAQYGAFLQALSVRGVAATDVLAATRRFSEAGGKPFFQRDIHWTPEGANAVAQDVGEAVTNVIGEPALPEVPLTLTKAATPLEHTGETLERLLHENCGYVLPSEPLYEYALTRAPDSVSAAELFGPGTPEVVLAGTSFSVAPYYIDFLAAALRTDVLNVSVSSGGAFIALSSYLLDGSYDAERPRAVVWEVPIWSPGLTKAQQRQLLGSVPGACREEQIIAQQSALLRGTSVEFTELQRAEVGASDHRLSLTFEDLSLLEFGLVLRYRRGAQTLNETLQIDRSTRTPNRGRYFFSLVADPQARLTGAELEFDNLQDATGTVTAQLCR